MATSAGDQAGQHDRKHRFEAGHQGKGEQRIGADADEGLLADRNQTGASGQQIPQLRQREHGEDVKQFLQQTAAGEARQRDQHGDGQARKESGERRFPRRRRHGEARRAMMDLAEAGAIEGGRRLAGPVGARADQARAPTARRRANASRAASSLFDPRPWRRRSIDRARKQAARPYHQHDQKCDMAGRGSAIPDRCGRRRSARRRRRCRRRAFPTGCRARR